MADPLTNQLLLGGPTPAPASKVEAGESFEPPEEDEVDPTIKDDLGVALQEFQSAKSVDAKVDALVAFMRLARGLI